MYGAMSSIALLTVAIVVMTMLTPAVASAATYYVSNVGSDANDGSSPDRPWQTLARVNAAALAPGDEVLFRRGDHWRGSLRPKSGSATGGYIVYGAYGSGSRPVFLGSVDRSQPEHWYSEGSNLWVTGHEPVMDDTGELVTALPVDVGNIILNDEGAVGVKVWTKADLREPGQYWYDRENGLLYMHSEENPALRYRRIECALRRHLIDESNTSYVIYENLALKYGAAHGIGGGNTHHITVRNSDFSFIGGGDQYGDGRTVRFGNGVEFWGNAHDNLVEGCRLWEIYDAALTNQNNGANVRQYNITYRDNVIWNSEYSFEYWNRPTNSQTDNIQFTNNTAVNAGGGWGHGQRPDPSGRHLCFYDSSAPAHRIIIRNNILYEAKGNGFYAPGWQLGVVMVALDMDNNLWYQSSGSMVNVSGLRFTQDEFAAYQVAFGKEQNSLVGMPDFVDAMHGDYRLQAGSPGLGVGADIPPQHQ